MKLFYKHLILLILSAVSLSFLGCQDTNTSGTQTLRVGTSADYPPFSFHSKGQITGMEIELAEAISRHIGYKLEIQDMDFPALIPALKSNRIDMVIASLAENEERRKNVDFSKSYYAVTPALIVLKKNLKPEETFAFNNKKIGAQIGSTLEALAKEKSTQFDGVSILGLTKTNQLIEELKLGRLDAIVIDQQQAIEFVKRNSELDFILLNEEADQWSIAFKQKSELKNLINQALLQMEENGELEAIKGKWINLKSN